MEYSLRRYEALQGLSLIVFVLVVLALAYPAASLYMIGRPPDGESIVNYQTTAYWMQQGWIHEGPLGRVIVYLVWASVIFLAGRLIWLVIQYVGKHYVGEILTEATGSLPNNTRPSPEALLSRPERLFRAEYAHQHANRIPHKYLFHSFQRLLLMLPNRTGGSVSSKDLLDRERRIEDTDWNLLHSSWTPIRSLFWFLPLLGLIQTVWLLYGQVRPLMAGITEGQEALNAGLVLANLLPLIQMILISLLLSVAHGIGRRLESIYLSGVDALFYDKFLSRLPLQSGDTLIILNALQRYFQEIHLALQRLEAAAGTQRTQGTE